MTTERTDSAGDAPRTTASSAAQRQHRERAEEQRLPAQEESGASRVEPSQDLVGLAAQDVRVVERPPELEEGEVEGDRDDDEQERRDGLDGHDRQCRTHARRRVPRCVRA